MAIDKEEIYSFIDNYYKPNLPRCKTVMLLNPSDYESLITGFIRDENPSLQSKTPNHPKAIVINDRHYIVPHPGIKKGAIVSKPLINQKSEDYIHSIYVNPELYDYFKISNLF